MDEAAKDRIIQWLAYGQTGLSSKTIAFTALGYMPHGIKFAYPGDPSDFQRCLWLLDFEPKTREAFPKLAAVNAQWESLIDHWGELKEMFEKEKDGQGENWSCPKTYCRMKELID